MIRKHPFRFLISVVGSFFVHVAAVFAMLMAVPEIAPTELFRPISVSLVPESSIPGTGIQTEEQTDDMGSELPSNPATSTMPADKTTEVADAPSTNQEIENGIQASSEFENESDAEPMEVVDSEPEAVPEPVPFKKEQTPLPEQTEFSAELSESTEGKLLDEAAERKDTEELTTDAEQIAQVQDSPQATETFSKERIEIVPDLSTDQSVEFADSTEVEMDLTNAENTTSYDSRMGFIDEEPAQVSATLALRQIQAETERAATDGEVEMTARIFPDTILDMADSLYFPLRSHSTDEMPQAPMKEIPVTPTTATLITEVEKNRPAKTRRTTTDIESELVARIFPRAISDMADNQSVPLRMRNVKEEPEPQLKDAPVVQATATLVTEIEEYQSTQTQRTATDIESELIPRILPDAIKDVIDEHPAPTKVVDTLHSRDIQSVETQKAQADLKIPEQVDSTHSNEPATLLATTDMEQEPIAWIFPDAIQDVIDEQAPASSFLETVDTRAIQTQFEENQPTETELAVTQSVNKIQLDKSLPPQSSADVEQELIARVLPDSIQDIVEDYPTPMEVHRTINVPEIQSFEEHTQQANLPLAEATKKRTIVDAADEVEARFAYSQIDESSLLSDAASTIEPTERIESKVASIAKTSPPQIVDENPSESERLSSSRKITSQTDLPT